MPTIGRRAALLGLPALAAAALVGGGCRPAPRERQITIGFLARNPEEPWSRDEWKYARKCADKYHFRLVTIGLRDGRTALSAIDGLADMGAEGFVIGAPDVRLGPAIVSRAERHGLKVYTVDDQLLGSDGKPMDVPHMGTSARAIGQIVGKALHAEYRRRGWSPLETAACAVTLGAPGSVKERTDGAADALARAGFPEGRIYRVPERATGAARALDAVGLLVARHPEARHWLVFSVNDEGVLGAVRAMESQGIADQDLVGIGIGGSRAFAEFAKSEVSGFHATCLISPRRHGYESVEYLYKWVKFGVEPPRYTRTTGTIVTRTDYKRVAKRHGLMD
ncbi:MAG: substrate-binding domain-containing protein [Chthonomonadales bacterium]|nr:substrate-binding domain-containing protein [Chthonomonadales bacterium]